MTLLAEPLPSIADAPAESARPAPRWVWPVSLATLGVAAAVVALWGLQSVARSEYYAAIALSMSESWSNFLFGALDPGGVVSLDKIPGSFWIPALFVRVFGFSTWSITAPNALATVAATLVVAVTARRIGGTTAGILAGVVTASTPIVMAVGRSNQPESFFVLALALVAWAAVHALQRASLPWLLVTGGFVAAAFHAYMLEAWAVWPALGVAYLFAPGKRVLRKLLDLAVAGVVSLALSFAWIAVVLLTPASDRPYVGSTIANNPLEMVFGYNGLGRFSATASSSDYRSFDPPFSGDPGVFRLFNDAVGAQVAWLIPAAIVAIAALWMLKLPRGLTVFLGGWFVTMLAMFSVVDGMHQFYTAALAIPMGLLVGVAIGRARATRTLWPQLLILAAAAVTAMLIASRTPQYLVWVPVVQAGIAVVTAFLLVAGRYGWAPGNSRWMALPLAAGIALTPVAWSVDTINHSNSTNPVAGDGAAAMGGFSGFGAGGQRGPRGGFGGFGGGFAGVGGGASVGTTELLDYLNAHNGSARFLLATFGAQTAATYITASGGAAVIPIGGFDGEDPAPTLAQFQQYVSSGELRYVLMGGRGGIGGGDASTGEIAQWVAANCSDDDAAPVSGLYVCG